MALPTENRSARDLRLEQVLAEYLQSVEAGRPVDRQALLAANPELADELTAFFRNREAIERLAEPIKDAVAPADSPTLPLAGTSAADDPNRVSYFGDYELLGEIARGGMGVVYKARQVSLNRIVAVKMILSGQLAGPDEVRRFRQEAEAAAGLDHPHIVPIYEVGEHRGQHYFSMGLVDGTSLAARMAGGPLPAREAAELVATVAKAVHYAHQRGIIHRDLKPANVLLDQQGRPRVTDFGLAKVTSGTRERGLTATGQVLGTPGYMPPEQVEGNAAIGPPADVYALGAILYALVTGRPPFQAATPVETMLQVLESEPVAPRQLNPSVPRDLDTIVVKCLEKRPEWRYESAEELAAELERFLAGEPIQARPPGAIERGMRWLGKQRRSVALAVGAAAVTALLLAGGLVGSSIYRDRQLGRLGLLTEHPRLVAELRDSADVTVVPPFTVPTQQPLSIPAGDYRLRATGQHLLSDDFQLSVERGAERDLSLSLDKRQLWPALEVPLACEVLRLSPHPNRAAQVLFFESTGLRLWESSLQQTAVWTVPLDPPTDPLVKSVAGFRWPWWRNINYSYSGIGKFDYRPRVLQPPPDLDGDAFGDVVLAFRHQPVLLAINGNGKVLWCHAAEGLVEATAVKNWPARTNPPEFFGTVVGMPLTVPDLDDDGRIDLIATFAVLAPAPDQAHRWIEAISGASGQTLWKFELPDNWFQLPAGAKPPYAFQWFATYQGGTSQGGGMSHSNQRWVFREPGADRRRDDETFLPSELSLSNHDGKLVVALMAGTRVVALDTASGQLASPAGNVGIAPYCPPRFADVDRDGQLEAVLVEQTAQASPQTQVFGQQRLIVWSLAQGKPRWPPRDQTANWERDTRFFQPSPAWPLVDDLDGDGRDEILVPNGRSLTGWQADRDGPWGALEVIDATGGTVRWQHRVRTMDQQLDQYLIGPDIDGDGRCEVFVASLFASSFAKPVSVFVDALSGLDGRTLWWSKQSVAAPIDVRNDLSLGQLQWWEAGNDGWPQLIVSALAGSSGVPHGLFFFSAGTGRVGQEAGDLDAPLLFEADGDGLRDLLSFQPADRRRYDGGGKLHAFRATSPVPWRRLGGEWQPGRDYDGDGCDDLLHGKANMPGTPRLIALSGRTGHELWRSEGYDLETGERLTPLTDDLNGDGVTDLLSLDGLRGSMGDWPPLRAYSGRDGRYLWTSGFGAEILEGTLLGETHDLDGDASPEVIFMANMTHDFPRGAAATMQNCRIWLVVMEGRTGAVRWRQPLSEPAGHSYRGENLRLPPAYVDLNGDNRRDLVVGALLKDNQRELRAYNGTTGSLLWSYPLGQVPQASYELNEWPLPVAGDLDGDRLPEVVVQVVVSKPPFVSQVYALDGRTGQPKWTWESSAERPTGLADNMSYLQRNRPRPLPVRLGEGRGMAVCAWVSAMAGNTGEVVLLDVRGQQQWQLPVTAGGVSRDPRVWVYDLNGDGADELVLVNGRAVQAWEAGSRQLLWEASWELSAFASAAEVLSIEPAVVKANLAPTVVVASGRTVRGLSGISGKPLWEGTGLPNVFVSTAVSHVELLRVVDGQSPPRVLTTVSDNDTLCLAASPVAGATSLPIDRAPARLGDLSPDSRYARQLPWSLERMKGPFAFPAFMLSGLWFSPLLILLPGYYVYRAIRYRRWNLRFCLMLPLVVSLFLLGLGLPVPDAGEMGFNQHQGRFFAAALLVPILVCPVLAAVAILQARWRRLIVWLVAALLVTLAIAVVMWLTDDALSDSGEFYVPDDWWQIVVLGAYSTAVLSLAAVVSEWLWRCWKDARDANRTRNVVEH